jgi:hypothetical protein
MLRAEPLYKRGQALAALWHAFAGPFAQNAAPPSAFVRRVVKFTELVVGSDEQPGAGTDIDFDLAAVFEIGVALDLQDIGMNQGDAARFVEMYRPQLRAALASLDLTPGQGMPVVMVLRARAPTEPVRFTETLPTFSAKETIWYEPEFLEGGESLGKRLEQLGGRDRKRIVIQIRDLAMSLAQLLPTMPAKKRGRQ